VSWNSDPVVVTVAVTGADVFRENNPNIPYTTQEIADSSIEAAGAGATVVHLHVREDDGTPSGRPELFVDVIDRIRAGSDLLTMVSTGGANDMTIEERTTGLEAKPDISGVESGSMNFGDETFITPPPAGRGIAERATDAGIALEVEAFDVGHVVSAVRWLDQGVIPSPLRINLVFGVPGGIDATPEALDAMLRPLPEGTFWTVTCIGRHHFRREALALLRGAPGVRTGLEDVAYIAKGVHAPSNAALVERIVELAGTVGREVATQEQTKELLQLG
jgi:3-keto-5-aminohexanoate cleavage enzyme